MSDETNQTPDLDENDLDELLAFNSMVSGGEGGAKPTPTEVRPEPPSTPEADEDVAFESPIEAAKVAAPAAPATASAPDDGDDITSFLESTGIQAQREVPNPEKPWMKHHKFVLVRTVAEVDKIVDEGLRTGKISLDLETEGLDNRIVWGKDGKPRTVHQIVGFCLSPGDGHVGYYVPVRHRPSDDGPDLNVPVEGVEAAITRLCRAAQPVPPENVQDPLSFRDYKTRPPVVIDFWNAKFDQEFLFPVTGIDWWHPDSFEDGMLAAFVCYTDDVLSLKDKAKELLRDPDGNPYEMIKLKELFPNGRPISFPSLSPDEPGVVKYACSDSVCTRLLGEHPEILPRVRKRKDLAGTYRIEKQVIQVVRVMERNRVKVNREKFRALLAMYQEKREAIRQRIVDLAASKGYHDFEPGSPKQLGEFLFGDNGMNIVIPNNQDFPNGKPPKNEKSGQYKTDASTLEQAAETLGDNAPPVLKWIIEYREHDKMIGTYLESLVNNPDENSELRFNFKETGAATGRFSAPQGDADQGFSGVPIHGIPSTSALRDGFESRDGYTMAKCDYAGQELRIAANVSGESVWINEFLHGEGDLHSITARAFFNVDKPTKEQRKMGKVANFALVYGGGPAAIMRATGCDRVEASRRKQAFDKAVPTFAKWIKNQHKLVKEKKGVWTAFGRFVAIPDIDHVDQAVRAACERHSTNYPVQGCLRRDAVVLTDHGYKAIGNLEAQGTEGLRVWTGTKWATFTAHNMGRCRLADVMLSDGTLIRCDTRHKLLVVTDEGYSWVEYPDLKPGDQVATALCEPVDFVPEPLPPIRTQVHGRRHFALDQKSLEDFWYWVGRYMGDGWVDDRGGLVYSFGAHEQEAIDRCLAFWEGCGLRPTLTWATHTQANKPSTRARVEVWSVELCRWLADIGITPATAHTKRLPIRIFRESLTHRRSFMCGFMDSDGHKPPGISAKGNPYNIHLCQRELLTDTKLLLRTLGVESCLRGPYLHTDKDGRGTTSYRLDIQRRMYERNVMGRADIRHAKFHDMFAPVFLVQNLLSKGSWVRSDFPDESLYNMYLRLKTGGKVGVYTLDRMCKALGVTLDHPIYGFKRLTSKVDLAEEDDTFTLSVNDPLHRFEADGVITKNSGADIMKIALILLHKEFYKRGWLKGSGDDSVRMLLTVHDEIVFEIKHERVPEVIPVIVRIMASPAALPQPPFSPKWTVPLVVEPLLGRTWGGKYNWEHMTEGKKGTLSDLRDDEVEQYVQVGDRIYQKIPPWLEGIMRPGWEKHGGTPITATSAPTTAPAPDVPVVAAPPSSTPSPAPAPVTAPLPPPATPPVATTSPKPVRVVTFRINKLSRDTIRILRIGCMEALDIDMGATLRVTDPFGNVVIEPSLGIRVDPDILMRFLRDRTLSDGAYAFDE